ncbi:pyruvate dehydrogenase protein X component, mitochondrial-like [Mytilus californianus]|uniref:pyruvate dehydrogenase protein X component, mitochondrial-like n=1 Tax=Mytilus californianus TaxID=6549 RepID=UPI002247ADC2|nr:pyruvate dehydrogenase protein X component, mitochondrial-like [Mytilus californianus]
MAASGIVRFGRRFSKHLLSTGLKEPNKITENGQYIARTFFTKCADQASTPVLMPALSPTMSEGTIVKWLKKEGESVVPGDVLCEIQTDKAVVSMEVDDEGILAKILKPENTADIKIGTLIAVMVEEGDDWRSVEIPVESDSTQKEPVSTSQKSPSTEDHTTTTKSSHTELSIGPSVRKLLEEYNITAATVQPSGPHGRLLKGDILKYVKSNSLSKQDLGTISKTPSKEEVIQTSQSTTTFVPGEEEEFIDIPLTNMRRTIARRLTESKMTIPHSYISIESNIKAVSHLRKQLLGEGIKVSMNDFIIKASAIALQRVPALNAVWQGEEVKMSGNVDISVAVATDQGLITPIIKNAAYLAVDEISSSIKDLAVRAREGKLQLHEFQGGTFTISNLGMFGISEFTAVINPPQTAIMAIGSSRLVAGEDGQSQTNMTVTVSYDSRAIDETNASQFLEVFKEVMESPSLMIVGSSLSSTLKVAGSY